MFLPPSVCLHHVPGNLRRTFWRNPDYNLNRHLLMLFVALLLGLSYLNLGLDQAGLRGRVSVIYFASVLGEPSPVATALLVCLIRTSVVGLPTNAPLPHCTGAVTIINAMPPMLTERAVYYREKANGSYNPTAYFWATSTVEIPFVLSSSGSCRRFGAERYLPRPASDSCHASCRANPTSPALGASPLAAILFTVVFYWLVGLRTSSFGFFLLVFVVFQLYSTYFGQCVAVWSPNGLVAQQMAPAIMSLWNLTSGFLITRPNIPDYLIWLYWFNP